MRLLLFTLFMLPTLVHAAETEPLIQELFDKLKNTQRHDVCQVNPVGDDACVEFEHRTKASVTVEEALRSCVHEDSKLIMLGETHETKGIYQMYPRLLEALKSANQNFDCLFLESDPIFQKLLDDFLKCQEGFEACYKPIEQKNIALELQRSSSPGLRVFYRELAEKAKSLNLKVYAVDPRNKVGISDRNVEMALAIQSKIPTCHFSAMVVGELHISERYYEELPTRKNNTAEQLRALGIPVEGILLAAEAPWDRGLKIPGCPNRVPYPQEARGLVHSFENQILRSLPLAGSETIEKPRYWNQFCASILIPANK